MSTARDCGQPAIVMQALLQLAQSESRDQHPREAAALMTEALPLLEANRNAGLQQRYLFTQTYVELHSGNYATATRLMRELLALHRSLGNTGFESVVFMNLASAEYGAGNYDVAAELIRESMALYERQREFDQALSAASFMLCALIAADRFAEAYEVGRSAVALRPEVLDDFHSALLVKPIAIAHAVEGNAPVAARLRAFARAVLARNGYVTELVDQIVDERLEELLRPMDADERAAAERAGAALSYSEALSIAFHEPRRFSDHFAGTSTL